VVTVELKYPDLRGKPIAYDIETKDPFLKEKGNGVFRVDGYILGVALSDGEFSEYYNLGHYDCTPEVRNKNLAYITEQLASGGLKVGANCQYDDDWLMNWLKIPVNGDRYDILIAEPLLDEYQRFYNLDNCADKYLGIKKFKTDIDKWCEENGKKITKEKDSRAYLWEMPYELVRKYAAEDARLTYKVMLAQLPYLQEQELVPTFKLEMGLFPLYNLMRKTGVRVDNEQIKSAVAICEEKVTAGKKFIDKEYGPINIGSWQQVAKLFNKYGFETGKTKKGAETANKKCFAKYKDRPIIQAIQDVKDYGKAMNDFFIGSFTNLQTGDGRLHGNLHPMRSDEGGTVSGRYSMSRPNLQQIQARHPILGPMSRRVFIPEDGCDWLSIDWSQVEYRGFAHYAEGTGSDELRQAYIDDPTTDFHAQTMAKTGLERTPAKNCGFGSMYGMGVASMAEYFGWDYDYAEEVSYSFHKSMPMIRTTMNNVGNVARSRGYIKTILGRRAHVKDRNKLYIMLNRLIQGSCADIMKKSMLDAYNSGVFDVLAPHITVHDEFNCSMPRTKAGAEAGKQLKYIMENAVKLEVPLLAKAEIGANWWDLNEITYEGFDELIRSRK
jgi:DNA polymerase-1